MVKNAITSPFSFPIAPVSNDAQVFYDSYRSTKLDVTDFQSSDKTARSVFLSHVIAERFAAGQRYEKLADREADTKDQGISAFWTNYHPAGMTAEKNTLASETGSAILSNRTESPINETKHYSSINMDLTSRIGTSFNYGTVSINIYMNSSTFVVGGGGTVIKAITIK